MSQEKRKRIHLIYGCVAAVLIVAVGIALILSCLDIYNSGAHPYSAEAISIRFERIAVLVYLCIAVIAGGVVLNLAIPMEKQRTKAIRDESITLNKFKARAGTISGEDAAAAAKEQKFRGALRITVSVVFAALLVYPAIYFSDSSHFTITNLSSDIIRAVLIVMTPAVIGLLLCFVCSVLETGSIRREAAIYKKAAAANKEKSVPSAVTDSNQKLLTAIRCVIVAAGICFIVLGIMNGGMKDVFDKAVAICTECIGLG